MLKRFFKPKWQHHDEQVRANALKALDEQKDSAILVKVATDDPVEKIRQQAVAKLSQSQEIHQVLLAAKDPKQWFLVASRLLELSPEQQLEQQEMLMEQFNQVKASWNPEETLQAIMACQNTAFSEGILLSSDNPETLSRLVLNAKSIDLKLKALAKIEDLTVLQRLSKQATHKSVLQSVRLKIKQAKAAEAYDNAQREQCTKICRALTRLAGHDWDAQFDIKVANLHKQWESIAAVYLNESRSEFNAAYAKCQAVIASKKQEAESAKSAIEAGEAQAELLAQIHLLLSEMKTQSESSVQPLLDAFSLIDKNWMQIVADYQPEKAVNHHFIQAKETVLHFFSCWENYEALKSEFVQCLNSMPENHFSLSKNSDAENAATGRAETVYQALSAWLNTWDSLLERLKWPSELACPLELHEWKEKAQLIEGKRKDFEISQKKQAAKINQKLSTLEKHLREKNLIAANKILNYIHFQINGLVDSYKKGVSAKLEKLKPQLDELRDWHSFATTPKKAMLCEAMEQLSQEEHSPLVLAEKVSEIQEQWHELIASDSEADNTYWDRFKSASDQAYQPCLKYYAEQDKIKADNLQQCMKICEGLKHYIAATDWDKVDWKACDKVVLQALAEWQQYHLVPANERKSLQRRFDKLIDTLKSRITNEKRLNLEARVELVGKAAKLSQSSDVDKAVSQAKNLQKEWKSIGVTFVKADREQWKLFRAELDKVFAKRDERNQAHSAELASNYKKLGGVIEKIQLLSALKDDQLKRSFNDYQALCEEWDESLEVPKNKLRELSQSYQAATNAYEQQYSGLEARYQKRMLTTTAQLISTIQKAEEDLLNGLTPNLIELATETEDAELYSGVKPVLVARLQSLEAQDVYRMNETDKRKLEALALQAEILADVESPSAWKTQRMSMQLEKLQQGVTVNNNVDELKKEVFALYLSWLSVGLIAQADRVTLDARLNKVLEKVGLSVG